MSLRTHSRWIVAATAVAIPALLLSTACSTDKAAAPASVAASDTVALDAANETMILFWGNPSESAYVSVNGGQNVVQTILDNQGDFDNYRLLMPFSLPKLAGKGVVDSAKMYNYVCSNTTIPGDSIIADHVNWGAVYRDSASWGGQTLQANIGTLVRDTTTGWKSLDVTSSVQADYVAKRANTQYRFEYGSSTLPMGYQQVLFAGTYCGNPGDDDAGQSYIVVWSH